MFGYSSTFLQPQGSDRREMGSGGSCHHRHRLGCRGWGAEVEGKILLMSSSVQKEFLWSGVAVEHKG